MANYLIGKEPIAEIPQDTGGQMVTNNSLFLANAIAGPPPPTYLQLVNESKAAEEEPGPAGPEVTEVE
jgi:hypothetical protein